MSDVVDVGPPLSGPPLVGTSLGRTTPAVSEETESTPNAPSVSGLGASEKVSPFTVVGVVSDGCGSPGVTARAR